MSSPLRNHTDMLLAALSDPQDGQRLLDALSVIPRHLVHIRDVANGLDFMLSGPGDEIRAALRTLVDLERRGECLLGLDYVQVEAYFLLRVVGNAECQDLVRSFLEEPGNHAN